MLIALILFYASLVHPQVEDVNYWLTYDEEEGSSQVPPAPASLAESIGDDWSFSTVYDIKSTDDDSRSSVSSSGDAVYTTGSQGIVGGEVPDNKIENDWSFSAVWDQDQIADDQQEMKIPNNMPDTPVKFPSLVKPECYQSERQCQCKAEWEFGGEFYGVQIYSGCANPDKDILSTWCIVDEETCPPDTKLGTTMDENGGQMGRFFDRCLPSCPIGSGRKPVDSACYRTVSDCTCQEVYNYQGRILNGCANPDADDLGSWCKIINGEFCGNQGQVAMIARQFVRFYGQQVARQVVGKRDLNIQFRGQRGSLFNTFCTLAEEEPDPYSVKKIGRGTCLGC
eukprot:TRINITY_DN13288_c0_g4_i3.p1 TRINITY_DN13288_c0_g4~~TRINITY_DN13288_c0_g4_i3.p1  ORF type:complete len:358 (+),score=33.26 TRINITY_DN13288_c0_g4_i3:60-1076(+)